MTVSKKTTQPRWKRACKNNQPSSWVLSSLFVCLFWHLTIKCLCFAELFMHYFVWCTEDASKIEGFSSFQNLIGFFFVFIFLRFCEDCWSCRRFSSDFWRIRDVWNSFNASFFWITNCSGENGICLKIGLHSRASAECRIYLFLLLNSVLFLVDAVRYIHYFALDSILLVLCGHVMHMRVLNLYMDLIFV